MCERLKTVARDVKMNHEIREGIAGLAPRTKGEAYGSSSVKRVYEEIGLLPQYRVEVPKGDLRDSATRRKRNADRVATVAGRRAEGQVSRQLGRRPREASARPAS